MASFPSIAPVYAAPKSQKGLGTSLSLGDGYNILQSFGLNALATSWELTFEISPADASTIDSFLQSQGDSGDKFQWQPPDGNAEVDWQCKQWFIQQTSHNWYRVRAKFERVYELTGDLVSESLVCDPQAPPQFDPIIGPWFVFSDKTTNFTRFVSTSVVADTDNALYIIGDKDLFSGTTASYVAKVDADTGTEIWNKKISVADGYTARTSADNSLIDDGNGTDGTISLFKIKRTSDGTTLRLYRIVLSKVDGSLVSVTTAQINKGSTADTICIVKKIGTDYICALRLQNVSNPCGGGTLSSMSAYLFSFNSSMGLNWARVFGVSTTQRIEDPPEIVCRSYPNSGGGVGNSAGEQLPRFLDYDGTNIVVSNPSDDFTWGHGVNYLKVNPSTGSPVEAPSQVYTGETLTTTNALDSSISTVDPSGNIYTDGYTSGSGVGTVSVVKWSGTTVAWRRNYNFGFTQSVSGQKLLYRDGYILAAYSVQRSSGPDRYSLYVFLIDPSDGDVITGSAKQIVFDDESFTDIGVYTYVAPMANSSGAIVHTGNGWFVRIDVNDMPVAGNYPMTNGDVNSNWTVRDVALTSTSLGTYNFTCTTTPGTPSCGTIGDNIPGLIDVTGSMTVTNPVQAVSVIDNTDFDVTRIGGYYS